MISLGYPGILESLSKLETRYIKPYCKEKDQLKKKLLYEHFKIYRNNIIVLKKLQNCILYIICVWPLFCSIWVYASLHFLPSPLEN